MRLITTIFSAAILVVILSVGNTLNATTFPTQEECHAEITGALADNQADPLTQNQDGSWDWHVKLKVFYDCLGMSNQRGCEYCICWRLMKETSPGEWTVVDEWEWGEDYGEGCVLEDQTSTTYYTATNLTPGTTYRAEHHVYAGDCTEAECEDDTLGHEDSVEETMPL